MIEQKKYSSDEELLNNFYKTNDDYWLGILLQRYSMLLLGVCMKYLNDEESAKDSVQEIFLHTLNEIKKHKVSYFKGWIYSVSKNHCLIKIRKQKHAVLKTEELFDDKHDRGEDNELQQKLEKENIFEHLHDSLDELNSEQRRCVELFYLENKSYKEIEQITGFSTLQVKSFIQNGKRNLKQFMEKKQQRSNG
ncbi:RNA polymerase sigma factor [Haoranjiania flava]|uniref:RNA polymerase sigma factor n=1 Tax=Haoranjiania flava TaxID=1856322 RepID=A0AAE3IP46_9BACT|nr:RNA polymerase sigma factor [Haoranjiania flava]MCU7694508.1 RNA polymerase sigma factor [Haoranjiania flava]